MRWCVASEPADGAARPSGRVPLVVVGESYRDASTDVRAQLASLEHAALVAEADPGPPDAGRRPSRALVDGGWAGAVVPVETCSRIEWVISSENPDFAAELLMGTLKARVGDGVRLHRKSGGAAVHYLLRVAMGLDSVAEGEPAVGRQMARAFELAHDQGQTDGTLRQLWRALQQLLAERRKRGLVRHGVGVQTLVVDALGRRGLDGSAGAVAVLGQGEIGRAVVAALRERGFTVHPHRRATWDAFLDDAARDAAVVVCTGGPTRFVDLPERVDGLVVDVGSPQQTRHAPGWHLIGLEELLSEPRAQLPEEAREWLTSLVSQAADRASQDLAAPPPSGTLGIIDDARRQFLHERLPEVLAGLPPAQAEAVRRAFALFAHGLMERVRQEGSAHDADGRAVERSST